MTLSNLQRALSQKQEECDEQMQQNEKQLRQHRTQLATMQNKVDDQTRRLDSVANLEERVRELEAQIEEDLVDRDRLEAEKEEMKRYASELVEKVKNEVDGKEHMIDRRMINTFLVQYLNPRSDDATRHHMMQSMSKILGFTIEEKQALGLVEREPVVQEQAQAN